MNILIISGSPRKGGNTELLAEAFAKGAAEHHHVEIVSVRDYKVNPCLGCNACFKTNGRSSESHPNLFEDGRVVTDEGEANGVCAQMDDMAIVYEKMNQAEVLVREVKEKADINNTDALNEAYTLGLSL